MTLRAVALEPNSVSIWANLGNYFWNLQRFDEAKQVLTRALSIEPGNRTANCTMGLVEASLGNFEAAEKCFLLAKVDEEDIKARLTTDWDRSLMYLAMGDYRKGFKHYETRIERATEHYERPPMPFWHGEPLDGKTIFLASEQGIGDNILFSRFVPWLCSANAKVKWCLRPSLAALFWEFRNLPGIEFIPEGIPLESLNADYYLFQGSLPNRYGCTLQNLLPDPGLIKKRVRTQPMNVRIKLPEIRAEKPFKVGIAWTGNLDTARNEERTIPLELMLELATIPKVWLHSFQVSPGATRQIQDLGAEQLICDLSPQLEAKGLVACGAALTEMDLVITCCTSIAHLAGSLDVPTWILLCKDPFWLWMRYRNSSPWYPSVRLFRQTVSKDWVSVMKEVRMALIAHLNKIEQEQAAAPVESDLLQLESTNDPIWKDNRAGTAA